MANAMDYIRSSNGQPALERPDDDNELQAWLDDMADLGEERINNYMIYREFYRGTEQKTYLTDRTKRFLERSGIKFRENFCETVIDVQSERLTVIGFSHAEEKVVDWATKLWTDNRMDAKQATIHTNALVFGDSFVLVDWDAAEGRPCLHFNFPYMIKVEYSNEDPDEMLYAVKVWEDDGKVLMNIYFPDRIEKYMKMHRSVGKGGWMQRFDEPDQDAEGEAEALQWPVPWVDAAGEPLGIPVFHFRNRALGECNGFSELDNVVPEQESLNKQVIDLNEILDYASFKQRWVTGMSVEDAGELKTRPGDIWANPNPEAQYGQFEGDDPEKIVAAIENTISRIARRSRTPLHLLTGGDMPSGEALRSAEAGLVKKVEACQPEWGNVWEDIVLFSMELSEANGVAVGIKLPLKDFDTEWKDPQSRNELEMLQAAILKHQLGVSTETLLMDLGYNAEDEINKRDAEKQKDMEMQAAFLDSGGGGGDLFGKDVDDDKKDKKEKKEDDE